MIDAPKFVLGQTRVKYHNAQGHLQSVERAFQKQRKHVESLRRQLEREERKLAKLSAEMQDAREYLDRAREEYRSFKHAFSKG